MAVTDLTGTTWVFNNTIPPHFSNKGEYYTEGDIQGLTPTSDYGYFIDFIWKTSGSEYNCNYIYNYNYDAGTTIGVATYPNGAKHVFDGTMTITGGTDATNADLISWLETNGTLQTPSTPRISVDLATAFPDKWAALAPGEHTIQIRAKNPGNYLDSDLSTAITFVKVVNWTINITATNCTADVSNPTVVPSNTTAENPVILKFNKATGYTLPTSVVLDGIADDGYTWAVSSDGTVGTITIIAPTGNITGTITGVAETYNITVKGTNARQASGPSTIAYGGSATLTFAYDDGYFAPTDVTVVGATKTWAAGTSTLNLTNCTGPVTVTIAGAVKTYTITPTLTNCTWDTENATTIASNQFTPIQLIINKNTGWTLPTEIQVSGVNAEYWSWNQATGIVTISHPQGNVTITASAVREVYNITTNLTHAVAGSGNPATVGYGLSATLTFTFPTGYEAPADVTVTGATKSWEAGTGTLTLTNVTGPVTVTVVGVATTTTIDGGTYKWLDNAALTEWTQEINFTSNGASYSGMRYTGNGTAMTLQYMNADSEWQTVYNYDEDASTGSWVNDAYKIVDLGTSAQTVTAIFKADFIANTTKLTQLSTPQNVTADGTVVSWDAVENATSYAVLADGSEIGTGEQLATPQNVTADRTTVSWNAVENATRYEILVGSSDFGAVFTTSVNLRELPGWESLTDGEYSVTIVAKADGYIDSDPSAVSVEKVTEVFVQIFPTATSDNYTLIENLNQSKIYSIQPDSAYSPNYIFYLKYENGKWTVRRGLLDVSYLINSQTDNSVKLRLQEGSGFYHYSSGITLQGDTEATSTDFDGFSPTAVYALWACFVEGTKITLSDGSTKPVQDIQYGDKVLCYDFTNGTQTTSYIDWMIPERIATTYWEVILSDGTVLNLVGPIGKNGKSHRFYNITKQRFDYPQDFEPSDLTLKEDGTTASIVSCKQIEKTVKFYNIASHEHINVYANGVLTSNRLNNRFKIIDNKFTNKKVMTDKEVADYISYLERIRAK